MSFALPTFRHQQVTLSGVAPQNFARTGDFKTFRHCFLRFAPGNRLWHKEPGKYALSQV
jgi:hypothetical protein